MCLLTALSAGAQGREQIELVPIREGDSHKYYRKNGVHYVPKLVVDDLIFNYLKNAFAEEAHLDFFKGLPKEKVIAADGEDITDKVETAVKWLTEHSF